VICNEQFERSGMKREEILKILKSLKEEVRERYKVEIEGIFGSYARGEEKEISDIDILVDFQKGANLFDLVGLANFLEEKLKCKVDVVSKRALREEIKPYVLEDLIQL
jgi:predicted nucleotidyltransferase